MTPQKVFKTFNLIKIGVLWEWKNLWGYGSNVHAKFCPWGMPWDPSYDNFCVLCWPSFSSYSIFWCMWGYMKVYKAIWRYMKVYEGIWKYIKVYEPTCSTLFLFQLVGGPLVWPCFFSVFSEGLHAPGGISSFWSWNFTSNGVLNVQKGWILVHAMTWRCVSESSQGFW